MSKTSNVAAGGLQGAGTGATIGAAVGGPMGALIGGGIGGAAGMLAGYLADEGEKSRYEELQERLAELTIEEKEELAKLRRKAEAVYKKIGTANNKYWGAYSTGIQAARGVPQGGGAAAPAPTAPPQAIAAPSGLQQRLYGGV